MVLLASHMTLISSHYTDILHDPHVKQICTHSQHTSAGLTILNVPSSPKQLFPGMPSLKVWSLAPHWMHSRRHCHWGDRYHASVFEHTNQRRAARWITSSYDRTTSVTNLLRQLNLEPLDKRRRIYRLTFLYKVLNEHVAVPPDKLDIKQNGRPVRGSVTKQRLVIPRCSTNELKNSFVPRTIVQWNALPDSTTSAASVNAFRSQLYKSCP